MVATGRLGRAWSRSRLCLPVMARFGGLGCLFCGPILLLSSDRFRVYPRFYDNASQICATTPNLYDPLSRRLARTLASGGNQQAAEIGNNIPGLGNMFLDPGIGEGVTAFAKSMGSPLTFGRRTGTDMMALNLAGKGGVPHALSASGKGLRSLLGKVDKALSLGLTLAERAIVDGAFVAGEAIACSH